MDITLEWKEMIYNGEKIYICQSKSAHYYPKRKSLQLSDGSGRYYDDHAEAEFHAETLEIADKITRRIVFFGMR
jgi:hypothetical protein